MVGASLGAVPNGTGDRSCSNSARSGVVTQTRAGPTRPAPACASACAFTGTLPTSTIAADNAAPNTRDRISTGNNPETWLSTAGDLGWWHDVVRRGGRRLARGDVLAARGGDARRGLRGRSGTHAARSARSYLLLALGDPSRLRGDRRAVGRQPGRDRRGGRARPARAGRDAAGARPRRAARLVAADRGHRAGAGGRAVPDGSGARRPARGGPARRHRRTDPGAGLLHAPVPRGVADPRFPGAPR